MNFPLRFDRYSDGADACEKIYEVAKCVQATVPEVNRFVISNQ